MNEAYINLEIMKQVSKIMESNNNFTRSILNLENFGEKFLILIWPDAARIWIFEDLINEENETILNIESKWTKSYEFGEFTGRNIQEFTKEKLEAIGYESEIKTNKIELKSCL